MRVEIPTNAGRQTASLESEQPVRFLGHDAYSACKHCASGYVLSFSFVYILTISLFFSCIPLYFSCISFTCTQFMPRMNWQGSLEDMRACIELRRGT